MLTGLGLRNFKAFGDEMQEAPLSKITLIYGPNSGGKSSIIQALLLLKQSLQADYNKRFEHYKRELVLRGELVDLNSFQSLLHKHVADRNLCLSLTYTNLDIDDDSAKFCIELAFSERDGTTHVSEVSYKITSSDNDKALFEADMDMDGYGTILGHDGIPFYEKHAAPISVLGIRGLKASKLYLSEYLPTLCLPELEEMRDQECDKKLLRADKSDELRDIVEAQNSTSTLLNARDRARSTPVDEKLGRSLERIELKSNEVFALRPENIPQEYERHLHSLNYLGPLRSEPQRIYRRSREYDQLTGWTGTKGEHSANVLLGGSLVGTTMQWDVKNDVNRWFERFEIPYELDVFELGEASLAGEYITVALTDKRTGTQVTLADVGYGINQILPVIIEGIASHKGSIICVEQPEIHLHPRLQANIADLMIDTIADEPGKRKQWIVETHSELLILRLQRRIREGKIKPEDISVLYVDPNDESTEGSAIKVLRLGEDSYFKDPWPDGFFADSLNEQLLPDEGDSDVDEDSEILDKLFSSE